MLSHAYKIAIDCGGGAPGDGKDDVDGLNNTEKKGFFTILMKTVKLTGAYTNNSQMIMHIAMSNTYISLEGKFKNIFQN